MFCKKSNQFSRLCDTWPGMGEKDLILALDIGTTNIKLAAIDIEGEFVRLLKRPLKIICKVDESLHEICPEELWSDIESLFKEISDGLADRIAAVGISTHRGTFITWEQGTENYLHNFITWSDTRSQKICDTWNKSKVTRLVQSIMKDMGKVIGSRHMVCAGNFQVKTANVQARLKWVMQNIPEAKLLYRQRKLCFGTLDTWLIKKLTGGATWATDYTNAAATGIYDLWGCKWCPVMTKVFSNPIKALPPVLDSNASFGTICPELKLGFTAPILGVVADQQASLIGNKLFHEGEMKLSLGTSLACDRLTGDTPHPVAMEVYPQIAWKLAGERVCYMAESMTLESRGKYLDLLVSAELLERIEDADQMATSVKSIDTPLFTELKNLADIPSEYLNDEIIADVRNTKALLTRAVLEAHAFRSKDIVKQVTEFYGAPHRIIVDGGASSSTFILECLAALMEPETEIYKSDCHEGALMGAYFMASMGLGRWSSLKDINSANKLIKINPLQIDDVCLKEKFIRWKHASVDNLLRSLKS